MSDTRTQHRPTPATISWTAEAEEALAKVPFFARKLVRGKVSERVAATSRDTVTLDDFREAEARFKKLRGGKSDTEVQKLIPAENKPGAETVVIESCHNRLSGCPNSLIDTEKWLKAIEEWIDRRNLNEQLRGKIKDERILFHHKLKISLSGCPNSCSRPQIASFGIVGAVRPDVDPADCTRCEACADACPDGAITVDGAPPLFDNSLCLGCRECRDICPNGCIGNSEPFARLYAGGKLGRHPHLADFAAEVRSPDELTGILDRLVDDYLANARDNERYSDYWLRLGKERHRWQTIRRK